MKAEILLKRITEEVASLRHEVEDLKEEVHEQRFEAKDSYIKKIKKIEAMGKFRKYKSIEGLRKAIENV